MRKILLIFSGLAVSAMLMGSMVTSIEITGLLNVQKGAVLSLLDFKNGDDIDDQVLENTKRNLLKTNMFAKVDISSDPLGKIKIEISENPIVNSFILGEHKGLEKNEIMKKVPLKKGSFFSDSLQNIYVQKLRTIYNEDGYGNAKIIFEIKKLSKNSLDIALSTQRGEKVKIVGINFFGNKSIVKNELIKVMKSKKYSLFRSGKYDENLLKEDILRIKALYNGKGYIDVSISEPEILPTKEKNRIQINFYIDQGEKFYFGELLVEGNIYFSESLILSKFDLKEDEIFNRTEFERQLYSLYNMYKEVGFIYAKIDYDLKKENGKVLISLKIQENARAKVRKIIIKGNKKTKEKIVRRKLSVYPGSYFQNSNIVSSQQRIYNTGFFEPDIKFDSRVINQSGDLDLIFDLTDKNSNTLNGSVGYTSTDGVVGEFSYAIKNLLGNAWTSSVTTRFSKSLLKYYLDFSNPFIFDTDALGGISIYNEDKQFDDYDWTRIGGSVSLGKSLYILNYSYLKFTYSFYATKYYNMSSDASQSVQDEVDKKWENTSSLAMFFSRSKKDNVFFPSLGSDISVNTELVGGPLAGDTKFFKQTYQSSWFVDLPWKVAFRTKWRTGYVIPITKGGEVPLAQKFYIGGMGVNGLRGYANMSIPDDDDGGQRMAIFVSELAFPVVGDTFIGLLFYDAGNCANTYSEFNFTQLKKSVGLGVRFSSPLGIIGFDYGYNLDEQEWRPQFQMGGSF